MRDTIPEKPWANETGVVNLDLSTQSGSHWVCYKKKGNNVEYYDSFGVTPPPEILTYLGINRGNKIFYNSEQEQQIHEVICGHLCLKFLAQWSNF